jgi:glycosyltransferase involved in cell wall biosynthesis
LAYTEGQNRLTSSTTPTVSTIVPVFNNAAFLGEALRSILGQTRPSDQIIVVDDGSTDESAVVARSFMPALTLVSQVNKGIGAARNAGLAAATGEVIGFLDADDLWPIDSLRARLTMLEADDALDAVYGLVEHFISPTLDDAARASLHCPVGQMAARFAGAMLVRRRAFERLGVFDPELKVGEMVDWAARLKDSGAAVGAVDTVVMRRRIHDANTTTRGRPLYGDYLRVLKASLKRKTGARLAEAGQ